MEIPRESRKIAKPLLSYRILKFFGEFYLMWPSDKKVNSFNRIFFELCWWIFLINDIFLFFEVSIGLYKFYKSIPALITTLSIIVELMTMCEKLYTTILFKINRLEFKGLITVLEKTVNNVKSKEAILLKQMESSALTNFIHWTVFFMAILLYVYLRALKPTLILPEDIWFPVFIDPLYKKYLLLFQQIIFISRIGVLTVADGLVFMIINNASVKLKVLSDNFAKVNNNYQLKKCIRQHQEILSYIKQINNTIRFMILKIVFASALYLTLGSLQFVYANESIALSLLYQFITFVAHVNYRVYYTARCAETLTTVSENLRFSLPWKGKSREMASTICLIIQRCQKPLYISVSGIMPQFSLNYYRKLLYFSLSYFLTLKAIIEQKG